MTSAIPIPISFSAIAPEIILLVTACVLLTVGVFLAGELARRLSAAAAAIALTAAAAVSATQFEDPARFAFDHTVRIDAFGQGARMLIFVSGLLAVCVAFGMRDLRERGVEYHALLLSACAGMSLLAVANSFVTTFVALELFSICLYVLVAIETDDLLSLEGGLKYLIIGSIGAAFLLYGAALVYGATGQLEFDRISTALSTGDAHGVLLLAGLALVLVGLGFKANAAPFHMWTPDAYEGAPTPVTAFMSAATKVVALVIALRVLVTAFPRQSDVWEIAVAGLVFACFIAGNLGALRQKNVKRMLAYSTVAHSGFLLTAVAANSAVGGQALLYYLTIYAAMNVGAFAIVAIRERELGRPVEVADFAGLGLPPPDAVDRDDGLHAVAGRIPADRRLPGQALHLERGGRERPDVPRHRRRDRDRGRPRLLPARAVRAVRPRRRGAGRPPVGRLRAERRRLARSRAGRRRARDHPLAADRPRPDGERVALRLRKSSSPAPRGERR